jgi:penicillin amidase
LATEAQSHGEELAITLQAKLEGLEKSERGVVSTGRPASQADWRGRIEPMHERVSSRRSFAHRFESGHARRFATPVDWPPRLCVSVSLWPLFLCVSLALCVSAACRQPPATPVAPPPLPQVSGTLALDGLTAPVRVVRDRWGVPHIYARNQDDLFFAQGFVQAQDRLFQMDLWRRSVQGRLSEVLGSNFIDRDAMTRRMQYRGDLRAEWASYGPDTEAIAAAFVRGVNAWVEIALTHLPEEFTHAGWRPDRWQAEDLLNRTEAFVASSNAIDEVLRARLVAALGPRRADALLPPALGVPTVVPRGLDLATISPVIVDAIRRVGTPPFFSGLAVPVSTVRLVRDSPVPTGRPDYLRQGYGGPPKLYAEAEDRPRRESDVGHALQNVPQAGSNAWAVSGARSATGSPLLATDPHRPLDHPSGRYLVHLNAPGWNVIGAAAPWRPGVVIGHNARLAWAMTSRAADVQDVYVERVNSANPHQVDEGGRWVDTVIVADPIAVKASQKPFAFEREYSRHGAVIAADRERHLAFTIRWTGFEPGTAGELAALGLDRAQSESELRAALGRWKLPAATFIYASADGPIGSHEAAWMPARRSWTGALPVPGWTGEYEWEAAPATPGRARAGRAVDGPDRAHETGGPRSGYVASANDNLARTRRLEQLLNAQPTIGIDDLKRMQHDTLAWNAEQLVPLLGRLRAGRPDVEDARGRLLRWDRRLTVDSDAATIYALWEPRLLRALARLAVPSALVDDFVARARDVLVPVLTKPPRAWFGPTTGAARDALLLTALADAVDAARQRQKDGPPPWGRLHQALFRHPLAVTGTARARFNVGPFERPGYADTVMSTAGVDVEQNSGASFSAVFDVADWDRSAATNAPGQSGSPGSPHFADLATRWAAGEYFPLLFSEGAVQAAAEATLTIVPRK